MEPDEKPYRCSDKQEVSCSKDNTSEKSRKSDGVRSGQAIGAKGSKYDHPVYEEISKKNGMVNRMGMEALRVKLHELKLHTGGSKEILQKRLKTHIKRTELAKVNLDDPETGVPIDYYIVVDLEATCEKDRPEGFFHEIIEFPALLLNAKTLKVDSEFWTYCRPTMNPVLSKFCTELTGIEQHQVDVAPTFPVVLIRFKEWLEQNLDPNDTFVMATDGPWDINRFLQGQCKALDIQIPYYFKKWVNVRKHFYNFYRLKQKNLEEMLKELGMTFEGRQHRGIDDSRNIARILVQLIQDGCDTKINDFLRTDFK